MGSQFLEFAREFCRLATENRTERTVELRGVAMRMVA
jgi:hypothetical protein